MLICSTVYAQKSYYWERIDFENNSGIKIISISQSENYGRDYDPVPFIVVTEYNEMYYFEDVALQRSKLNFTDTMNIKKVHFEDYNDSIKIVILADNQIYFSNDFGDNWKFLYPLEETSHLYMSIGLRYAFDIH